MLKELIDKFYQDRQKNREQIRFYNLYFGKITLNDTQSA